MKKEKAIFKFWADCGRMGDMEGIFVSTQERVDKLIESKIEVYFGECLGKHSEVYGIIEPDEIKMVSNEKEAVKLMQDLRLSNGFNPFDYTSINFELEGYDLDDMSVGEIIDILLAD